jgi:hypothetical protein
MSSQAIARSADAKYEHMRFYKAANCHQNVFHQAVSATLKWCIATRCPVDAGLTDGGIRNLRAQDSQEGPPADLLEQILGKIDSMRLFVRC